MTEPKRLEDDCLRCGESTGPGSPFYSDRRLAEYGGRTGYLCSECAVALSPRRADHKGEGGDIETVAENGTVVGVGFLGGGGGL